MIAGCGWWFIGGYLLGLFLAILALVLNYVLRLKGKA